MLKPKVHITHLKEAVEAKTPEFLIPGGVFISEGHCWANINDKGMVKVGLDDLARKLIGKEVRKEEIRDIVAKAHHSYPCTATMAVDKEIGEPILHKAGYLIREAVESQLFP